ncbi:4a-hydroxytetrahydrobiopterin dehydratase [Streptomyces sp. NPDC059900]|uniref:4a-hydroxytetrahydrobiopterin dehydratase n=1 Tax=Streptomyces sp. NPDC059900 TaxID=3155816 RepID=UPI00343D0E4D
MEQIFISYRREDAAGEAWLLERELNEQLGGASVFLDTSGVEPGAVWPERLHQALDNASAVLVVIGPNWMTASDEWARRRIDLQDDWVRREIEESLNAGKHVVPILTHEATMPPSDALPQSISELSSRQAMKLRDAADVALIVKHLIYLLQGSTPGRSGGLYPRPAPELPDPLSEEKIGIALRGVLSQWSVQRRRSEITSTRGEGSERELIGLYREYRFHTFEGAVSFMHSTVAGCDIMNHHPTWENIWRTVRIFLSTWDIDHRISDRDVQLAKFFERSYETFPAAERSS